MRGQHSDKFIYGMRRMLTAIVLSSILGAAICACAGPSGIRAGSGDSVPVSRTGLYFDTVVTVTLYDYDGSSAPILDECMEMCERYESLYSPTLEGSDVWRINHSEGSPVSVDAETVSLIREAVSYCNASDGVLDLTVGGLCDLWNIDGQAGSDSPVVPGEDDIKEALSHIDYRQVSIDGFSRTCDAADNDGLTVKLGDPDSRITLGFIAKGYIADRLADYLRDAGVKSALIDLGGNIEVIGSKPDGDNFRIGIQKPFSDRGESISSVSVPDGMSVVSSGTYERFFTSDGHIYHHILDTKTGYPADNDVCGVTVISESAVKADALSTLCLLLGADSGLKLIESTAGTEALFIASDYSLSYSSGWNDITP